MTTNETLDLIQLANQYNFDELVKVFRYDQPQEVAKSLLTVYFRLSRYILEDSEMDFSNDCDIKDGMYHLQSIYEAISQLDKVNDAALKFTIK